ncbi:MAG: GSCFA domain-containing protein [Paramuribaculum sp.]|nr:GSCFA domain-containing protein [Paramuribaculum sp.]
MMQFRTIVRPISTDIRIDHRTAVIMLGSCFSDNIGRKLAERMFHVVINPLGTVYNPASIAEVIRIMTGERQISLSEFFLHEGLWRHFLCHSSLARPDRGDAEQALNMALAAARHTVEHRNAVAVLTLGTARVFEREGKIVSNCHKLPGTGFNRRLLSVDEATMHIDTAVSLLAQWLPGIRVILTVSPIRHMECGLEGNSLSKAVLRIACQNIADTNTSVVYFPAFEALTDDLRDYRFYDADMKHPSAVAVDYVYELFEQSVMSEATRRLAAEALSLTRRLAHRPMSPDPDAVRQFAAKTELLKESFFREHPELT